MFALILGKVVSIEKKMPESQDDKFNGHYILQILQKHSDQAELTKVKDYNLTIEYKDGQDFKKLCRVRDWFFNGKSGLSAVAIND